jgi:DNA-binding NarL/FixJ family response regulator
MNHQSVLHQNKISILIADDHRLLRETWSLLLNKDQRFSVTGHASNGGEAIQMAGQLSPDVILMDISMMPVNGFDAIEAILKAKPASKIIAVSVNSAAFNVKRMLKMGGLGYVSKNSPVDELCAAIVEVFDGKSYLCAETKSQLAEDFMSDGTSRLKRVSTREIEVIQLIKQGLLSHEIAERLEINIKTVEMHRYNILRKLKLKNAAALVNFCNEKGI